jgi:hypothetical protein
MHVDHDLDALTCRWNHQRASACPFFRPLTKAKTGDPEQGGFQTKLKCRADKVNSQNKENSLCTVGS